MKVITGTNLLDEGGDKYEVEKLIPHADYDSEDILNDIALIYLKDNITYGPNVKPVQLPEENTRSGRKLLLSGWGTTAVRIFIIFLILKKYTEKRLIIYLLFMANNCRNCSVFGFSAFRCSFPEKHQINCRRFSLIQ